MSVLGTTILVGFLVAIFTALLTYFITTLSSRGYLKNALEEGIKNHVGIHHKTDLAIMIESIELKLEKRIDDGLKENKDSIITAHKRIYDTITTFNKMAVDIAEIKTSQSFIVEAIKKGLK